MQDLVAKVIGIELKVRHNADGTTEIGLLGVLKEGSLLEQLCVKAKFRDTGEFQPGKIIIDYLIVNTLDYLQGYRFIKDWHRWITDYGQTRLLTKPDETTQQYLTYALQEYKNAVQKDEEEEAERQEKERIEGKGTVAGEEISTVTSYKGVILPDFPGITQSHESDNTEVDAEENGLATERTAEDKPDL